MIGSIVGAGIGKLIVWITDVHGFQDFTDEGINIVLIQKNELQGNGILYYNIETEEYTDIQKVIKN